MDHVRPRLGVIVLPGRESRTEEGFDHLAARDRRLAAQPDEFGDALLFVQHAIGIAELGAVALAQEGLQFLVDHLLVEFDGRQPFREFGIAVLDALDRGQEVVEVAVSELRLEGIDEQVGMAVEMTMGDVPAVLEARGNHGQPEVIHASTPASSNLDPAPV